MVLNPVISRYGRVTEATIDRFSAECFERECAPPLGELLAIEDGPAPIFAVVAAVVTQGIDPTRRVGSHGSPDDDLERVLAENPHVPALLSTTFAATVIGHYEGGQVRAYLPPAPALMLARVRACTEEERNGVMRSFDFLKLLLAGGPFGDEVIGATLRRASEHQPDPRAFLVRGGKALAPLLANDPMRLHAILRRLQP